MPSECRKSHGLRCSSLSVRSTAGTHTHLSASASKRVSLRAHQSGSDLNREAEAFGSGLMAAKRMAPASDFIIGKANCSPGGGRLPLLRRPAACNEEIFFCCIRNGNNNLATFQLEFRSLECLVLMKLFQHKEKCKGSCLLPWHCFRRSSASSPSQ